MKFHFIPAKMFDGFLLDFCVSGAKAKKSCRARKMLKNASFLAIVAVDTAENEPLYSFYEVHSPPRATKAFNML